MVCSGQVDAMVIAADEATPRNLSMVLKGYFDDSGMEGDLSNRIACIGGYLANDHAWSMFASMWGEMLLKHGIPWLHMADFMQSAKEYKQFGGDWDKMKPVLFDAMHAIRLSQIVGFGVAIDLDAWRQVPSSFTQAEGDGHQFCFSRILRMVVDRVRLAEPDSAVWVHFDCDINLAPARFQKFLHVREAIPDAKRTLLGFGVGDPMRLQSLQAADFLAWETRKAMIRRMNLHSERPEFEALFASLPWHLVQYSGEWWDEGDIKEKVILPHEAEKTRDEKAPDSKV